MVRRMDLNVLFTRGKKEKPKPEKKRKSRGFQWDSILYKNFLQINFSCFESILGKTVLLNVYIRSWYMLHLLFKTYSVIQKHTDCIWVVFNAWNQWTCSVNIGYMCKWTQKHKKAKGSVGNGLKHTHLALKRYTTQSAKTLCTESVRSDCMSRTGFLTIRNKNESPSTLNSLKEKRYKFWTQTFPKQKFYTH